MSEEIKETVVAQEATETKKINLNLRDVLKENVLLVVEIVVTKLLNSKKQ